MKLFRSKTQTPVSTEKQQQFMELLQPVYDGLYRFIYAMTRQRDKADDLMSETILKAYEGFDSLKEKRAFFSFVLTIAKRLHKRREWRARLFSFDNEVLDENYSYGTSPETAVDAQILLEALNDLPEKQREALVLFEISGFSLEEICTIQESSLSAVKSRLARGRQKLAAQLGRVYEPNNEQHVAQPSALYNAFSQNLLYSTSSATAEAFTGTLVMQEVGR